MFSNIPRIIIFQSLTEILDLDDNGDIKKIVYSDSSLFNYQYFPELFIVDPEFCSLGTNKLSTNLLY